jgi:signal transduction histidine kinase
MDQVISERPRSAPPPTRDFALLIGITLTGVVLSVRFDLFERFHALAEAHELWQVDEVAIVSMFLIVGLGAFGRLRRMEYLREMARHDETHRRLVDLIASKDELIASISHELRTPLTAVVGYAHMLNAETSGLSQAERDELLKGIVSQGTDLANIVEDLLVAARADAGVLTVARVGVDFRGQIAQVLEDLGHEMRPGGVEVVGTSCRALADPARVRQIVRNLVSNAIRYGGDHVLVSLSSDAGSARVAVCDDGPGVPPDQVDRIFEPYHRSHITNGLTAPVGLGLTVSRKLARLMDGDLVYRRERGSSVFELTLPCA